MCINNGYGHVNGLADAIAADRDSILDFTKELVAIATENPPGAFYKPCVDVIAAKLAEIGLQYLGINAFENMLAAAPGLPGIISGLNLPGAPS